MPITWLLGFIQATKGSPRTHDVIFTNGRKEESGSVDRKLDWRSKDWDFETHQSQCCVLGQDALSAAK